MRRLAVCLILAFACTVAWAVSADVAPTDSTAQDIESQAATGSPPDKTTSEDLAPEIPSPIKPSTPLGPIEEPAAVQDMGSGFIHLSADSIRTTSDEEGRPLLTIASGNIMARYRNMSVTRRGEPSTTKITWRSLMRTWCSRWAYRKLAESASRSICRP